MREVLFRAKNRNADWIYGSVLFHDGNNATMFYQHPYDGHIVQEEVDPETVGEFTGFLDKKGNKVFEGDILQYDHICAQVVYGADGGAFCAYTPGVGVLPLFWQGGKDAEVIDNIHDSPQSIYLLPERAKKKIKTIKDLQKRNQTNGKKSD